MFCILGGISVVAHLYNLNSIKSKTVGDGQHGTARWATKSEIHKTYRHIPFTPNKWRKQAEKGETPTASRIVKRRFFKRKKKEQPEEALPQGIVVGCIRPSQQRRAARRDPRSGEIPMRPKAWPGSAFPCIRGMAWFKYRITKTIDTKITGGRLPFWINDRLFYLRRQRKWNK